MPHLRTEAVYRFVGAIGLAPNGVDFQSLDGAPTKLIFLLLGPYAEREQHFELMGRLSALMRDKTTLMFLQGHRAPHEVCEYLADLDARAGEADHSAAVTVAGARWKQPARSTGRG
jgi:mannitol/fructose-specific phosphotransferase system IIA component (Ntr-type)